MSDILCMAYAGENIMNKSNPFSSILTSDAANKNTYIEKRVQRIVHRSMPTWKESTSTIKRKLQGKLWLPLFFFTSAGFSLAR